MGFQRSHWRALNLGMQVSFFVTAIMLDNFPLFLFTGLFSTMFAALFYLALQEEAKKRPKAVVRKISRRRKK